MTMPSGISGMQEVKHFAPSIVRADGTEITPKGWEWVLAFALKGVKWAEVEVLKPEFEAQMRASIKEQDQEKVRETIKLYEEKIKQLKPFA